MTLSTPASLSSTASWSSSPFLMSTITSFLSSSSLPSTVPSSFLSSLVAASLSPLIISSLLKFRSSSSSSSSTCTITAWTFGRHRSSPSSMVNSILTTLILSISLNLLLTTTNYYPNGVYSWNWDQHISEELLDRFICLRAKGFFPHEHRCDHFYECRNGTIVNEGICRPGLRFDYRYRKKPRCIPLDQIDCRITQIDYNEYSDTPEPTFIPTVAIRREPFTTTTTTTTQSPPLLTIHHRHHIQHHHQTGTTTPTRNSLSSLAPISQFRHYTSLTTTNKFSPSVSSNAVTTTTTMSTTTVPAFSKITTTTESPLSLHTTRNYRNDVSGESGDTTANEEENFLSKKRKLLKKPLKLRRGRLQQPPLQDEIEDSTSSSMPKGTSTGGQPPRLTEQILSRAISTLNFDHQNPHHRQKSIHCPHPNGYYPDRDDCRKFYACDDGRAFLMSCPLGLAYDEMTGTCSWPDMVEGCRSEEMLRFSCPEPNENEILDYGDPRYPTSDCRKFVVCIQSEIHGTRTPRLLGCEEGLVFNPESRECDYPENVPSCSNYYDGHPFSRSISRSISSKKRKNRF